jgi:hypothetical protein
MIYQDWQSLCASDPAKANAICREVMGDSIMVGPAKWEPISDRNHAAMMVDEVVKREAWALFSDLLEHEVDWWFSRTSFVTALMAPSSLISYCACVALDKEAA